MSRVLRMWITCSSFRLRPRLGAWRRTVTVRLCLHRALYTCTLQLMRNIIWHARHSPLTYAPCFHMLRLFPVSTQFVYNSPCMWGFSSFDYPAAHDAYLRGTTISLSFSTLVALLAFLVFYSGTVIHVCMTASRKEKNIARYLISVDSVNAAWICRRITIEWESQPPPLGPTSLPPPPVFTRPQKLVLDFREAETKRIDRRRDRTCNLLIRSQAPCHWASRPGCYGDSDKMCTISGSDVGLA